MKNKPVFVVLFIGSAVKLISSNRSEIKPEDQKYLKEIAETISKMSKAGIRFEVCLTAAKYFGVDPASIQSEIIRVGNGWISEIGYQARGYQLVPSTKIVNEYLKVGNSHRAGSQVMALPLCFAYFFLKQTPIENPRTVYTLTSNRQIITVKFYKSECYKPL